MNNENINGVRFERIVEIHKLLRMKRPLNCRSFARHWDEKWNIGARLSRKTILRDIEWMRRLGAPIEYDERQKTFYYTEQMWDLPLLQISEGEMLSLALARQMGARNHNSPFGKGLDTFFKKMTLGMTNSPDLDPDFYNSVVSFHGRKQADISETAWREVFASLRHGKYITFSYKEDGKTGQYVKYTVGPVHVANIRDTWYLLGYVDGDADSDWTSFDLSKMNNARMGTEYFIAPKDFCPKEIRISRNGRPIPR